MPASAQRRFYTIDDINALPDGERAELIDGQVYLMSLPSRKHQDILSFLHLEIGNYIAGHNGGCKVYPAPFAVFLDRDERNYVEPDICVVCDPGKLTEKGCSGAPDWIVEVASPGSRTMDYDTKLFKYRTAGVREYWIVDHERNLVTVYSFLDHSAVNYTFSDDIPVRIYPGYSINLSTLDI